MNLNITLIKKFNFDVLALYLFFLWKISPGIFADGFNYDDSHEILISRANSVYDFFAFADHHFLYSLILYLISFLIPFVKLQIINLLLVLGTLFFTKKLYELLSFSYASFILGGIILISSPIFLEYSIRIKQYTLDYCLVLLMIYMFAKLENSMITSKQFQLFGLLASSASLILLPVFITFLIIRFRNYFKELNFKILIFAATLAYFFFKIGFVRLKIFDEKYTEYFSFSFFQGNSVIDELNNLVFALLIFFRGVSDNGFIFLFLIFFSVGLVKSYKTNKTIVEAFILLLITFCLLHLFDLYPISAGRNMTFMFPFIIIFSSQVVNFSNNKRISSSVFIVISVLLTSFSQSNYPNSYISEFVEEVNERELTIVDFYLIPQYSLYSNSMYTNIQRMFYATDECLYSSKNDNIIFLNDKNCAPLTIDINSNIEFNDHERIVFLSEENKFNTKDDINKVFENFEFYIVSEDKLGKTYKLIYEK